MTSPFRHRSPWLVSLVAVATFLLLDWRPWFLFRALSPEGDGWTMVLWYGLLRWLPWVIAPLGAAAILCGPARAAVALGLDGKPFSAAVLTLFLTAALPVTYALTGKPVLTEESAQTFLTHALFSGIGEEVLYRGLLFGLLFRLAGWGFLPAALLNTVIFGVGHMAQGESVSEALGVVAITGVGAFWFSWLFAEWDDLWVPIWLHVAMNGWWIVFEVSENALGPAESWAARGAVILLSVLVTVATVGRRGGRAVKGRAWFWGGPAR